MSHFLLILMKNGFDEGSFETAHLPKIGGHLLTLVLIIGLPQFSQIVQLVLRFVKEQTLKAIETSEKQASRYLLRETFPGTLSLHLGPELGYKIWTSILSSPELECPGTAIRRTGHFPLAHH